MNLSDVDAVKVLISQRETLLALRDAARTGSVGVTLWLDGQVLNPFPVISKEPVRSAIIVAAEDALAVIDKELQQLGVRVSEPFQEADRDVVAWRRHAEMLQRAWIRELGGKLIPKAHLIDALVLTTEQLRKRAEANSKGEA